MSVYTDVEVSIECDKCYKDLSDWEKVYCSGCAGIHDKEHFDTVHAQTIDLVRDWFDDNELILADSEYAFGQEIIESMRSGRMPKLGRR